MYHGIQSRVQVLSVYLLCVGYAGCFQYSRDNSIWTSWVYISSKRTAHQLYLTGWFIPIFEVDGWLKFTSSCAFDPFVVLDDGDYFLTLWAGREDYQSPGGFLWRVESMRLVFIANGIASMVYHFLVGHSKSNQSDELCKYRVRERNIEKGIQLWLWIVDRWQIRIHVFRFLFSFSDDQQSLFILYDISKIQDLKCKVSDPKWSRWTKCKTKDELQLVHYINKNDSNHLVA